MSRKFERPLYLDMDTDEALARFVQTSPEEVEQLKRQAKEAAEGGDAPDGFDNVIEDKEGSP